MLSPNCGDLQFWCLRGAVVIVAVVAAVVVAGTKPYKM